MSTDNDRKRVFFAINLPEDTKAGIGEIVAELNRIIPANSIRWCREDQWHFTLKFLGETPSRYTLQAVEAAVRVAKSTSPFSIRLEGVGAFPNPRRPSIIWLGLAEGAEEMSELAVHLDEGLHKCGFQLEKRPFKPHLTLARIKTYEQEKEATNILGHPIKGDVGTVLVNSFALMRSHLLPEGAKYEVIELFHFKG